MLVLSDSRKSTALNKTVKQLYLSQHQVNVGLTLAAWHLLCIKTILHALQRNAIYLVHTVVHPTLLSMEVYPWNLTEVLNPNAETARHNKNPKPCLQEEDTHNPSTVLCSAEVTAAADQVTEREDTSFLASKKGVNACGGLPTLFLHACRCCSIPPSDHSWAPILGTPCLCLSSPPLVVSSARYMLVTLYPVMFSVLGKYLLMVKT